MRAAVFHEHGAPDVLRIEDRAIPDPGPGEVRIRVCAVGLNHLDLWARQGLPFEIPMPHIGGSDIAGWVDAIGPGPAGVLSDAQVGGGAGPPTGGGGWVQLGSRVVVDPSIGYDWYDRPPSVDAGAPSGAKASLRVIGEHTQGGLAEFCVVPKANLVSVPEHVALETAAASALNAVTAWHGLVRRGGLRSGETVLITGASGGVATCAIQIAKARGATVFAVTHGEANTVRVRELGADAVYDRAKVDAARELWRDTGKRGVDLVFDSVGEAMWTGSVRSLAPRGRLVIYGATTGPHVELDLRHIFWRQLSVVGTTMGPPESFREAMGLVFDGTLRPAIDRVFPLEGIRAAHELLEDGGVFGKLLIRIAEEER